MASAAHAVAMLIVATEHNNAATFDSQLEELEESTDHTAAPVVLNRLEVQARGFRHVHEAVPMDATEHLSSSAYDIVGNVLATLRACCVRAVH